MAISNSRPQIPMPLLTLTLFTSFLSLAHSVNSASFNFDTFQPYINDITLEGDAFITSNGSLQLTEIVPNGAGRASYAAPVRLWDSQTGKLAWFTTTFSFVVGPATPGLFGDGISFFVAPFSSYIPYNSSGGFLGLFSAETALNAYKNQIVAVEFDTYGNPWDPVFQHMGIDINSIDSATTVALPSVDVQSGLTAFATVNYEPNEKNLSVVLTYPQSRVNETTTTLSFIVDLRTILPEWVRIGFSGATGQVVEQHKILSWTFNSSLS